MEVALQGDLASGIWMGVIGWFVPPWLAEEHPDQPPYTDDDYFAHVDGKPRYDGVRFGRRAKLAQGDGVVFTITLPAASPRAGFQFGRHRKVLRAERSGGDALQEPDVSGGNVPSQL